MNNDATLALIAVGLHSLSGSAQGDANGNERQNEFCPISHERVPLLELLAPLIRCRRIRLMLVRQRRFPDTALKLWTVTWP